MKPSKRQTQVLILVIAVMLLYTSWYTYGTNDSAAANEHEGIIRFHVIANSDSAEDQELKLQVRDEVLKQIHRSLAEETMVRHDGLVPEATLTAGESRQYILENLSKIENIAETVIRENGYSYTASADLGMCWIPEKKYGEIMYPAGNYEALNITIGQGLGENWWCVLFPPLCVIDTQPEDEKALAIEGINPADGADMKVPEGGIRLKFKTVEIIDSLNRSEEDAN